MNLLNFSKMVQTFFEGSFISSFQNWEAAFEYITGKISDEKLVLIIDELPFDYLESAEFFPNYSKTEKAIAYGILGGVPRYLEAFSSEISLEENIKNNLLTEGPF